MKQKIYDMIIIGGGASGLCCACMAKRPDISVLVIEHSDRVGKKILQTGNGKCNLSNEFCKPDLLAKNPEGIYPYFTSGDPLFINTVISQFDVDDTISFFSEFGVLTENKEGYIYPRSEQASTVLNALRFACEYRGVEILADTPVISVKRCSDDKARFIVNNSFRCRNLVVATGGMAAPKTGSDGSFFSMIKSLGHTVISPVPALCAINCSDSFFKELKGVRNSSRITVMSVDGKEALSSFGNLQFTSSGISGIPVFQISHEVGKLMSQGLIPKISIDLLPENDEEEISKMIGHYCSEYGDGLLPPILNSKLVNVIKKQVASGRYGNAEKCIKNFTVTPKSLASFDEAQTSSGGVSTKEINADTMESKIVPGLYFTGEVMDINGICGGYNLQWAWSTAFIASKSV